MNKLKILKALGLLIGWITSILLISPVIRLLNAPNSVSFVFGAILTILVFISAFACAGNFIKTVAQLAMEYNQNKNK